MNETGAATVLGALALRKEYGRDDGLVRAVDGVDLDVTAGETLAVMGPSGCGKSTLLHLLGGQDRPTSGELWLAGQRIDRLGERALARLRREAVGFVFQAFHLMDELTAAENVELPALLAGVAPRKARRRATGLLEQVGLADRAGFLPSALSGGQRQRAAVARRWPTSRWSCWPMSPPAASTASPPWTCCGSSTACTPPGRRWSS
jgi:ABC-type lipoprotein export system ATPase subunit